MNLVLALALKQKPAVCHRELTNEHNEEEVAFALNSVRLFGHAQLMLHDPSSRREGEEQLTTEFDAGCPLGMSQEDFDYLGGSAVGTYRAFVEGVLLMALPGEEFTFKLTLPKGYHVRFARIDVWLK